MIRAYENLKQVCGNTLVPRLLKNGATAGRNGLQHPIPTQASQLRTDSKDGKDKEEQLNKEKCQRIINYCFGKGPYPVSDVTGLPAFTNENVSQLRTHEAAKEFEYSPTYQISLRDPPQVPEETLKEFDHDAPYQDRIAHEGRLEASKKISQLSKKAPAYKVPIGGVTQQSAKETIKEFDHNSPYQDRIAHEGHLEAYKKISQLSKEAPAYKVHIGGVTQQSAKKTIKEFRHASPNHDHIINIVSKVSNQASKEIPKEHAQLPRSLPQQTQESYSPYHNYPAHMLSPQVFNDPQISLQLEFVESTPQIIGQTPENDESQTPNISKSYHNEPRPQAIEIPPENISELQFVESSAETENNILRQEMSTVDAAPRHGPIIMPQVTKPEDIPSVGHPILPRDRPEPMPVMPPIQSHYLLQGKDTGTTKPPIHEEAKLKTIRQESDITATQVANSKTLTIHESELDKDEEQQSLDSPYSYTRVDDISWKAEDLAPRVYQEFEESSQIKAHDNEIHGSSTKVEPYVERSIYNKILNRPNYNRDADEHRVRQILKTVEAFSDCPKFIHPNGSSAHRNFCDAEVRASADFPGSSNKKTQYYTVLSHVCGGDEKKVQDTLNKAEAYADPPSLANSKEYKQQKVYEENKSQIQRILNKVEAHGKHQKESGLLQPYSASASNEKKLQRVLEKVETYAVPKSLKVLPKYKRYKKPESNNIPDIQTPVLDIERAEKILNDISPYAESRDLLIYKESEKRRPDHTTPDKTIDSNKPSEDTKEQQLLINAKSYQTTAYPTENTLYSDKPMVYIKQEQQLTNVGSDQSHYFKTPTQSNVYPPENTLNSDNPNANIQQQLTDVETYQSYYPRAPNQSYVYPPYVIEKPVNNMRHLSGFDSNTVQVKPEDNYRYLRANFPVEPKNDGAYNEYSQETGPRWYQPQPYLYFNRPQPENPMTPTTTFQNAKDKSITKYKGAPNKGSVESNPDSSETGQFVSNVKERPDIKEVKYNYCDNFQEPAKSIAKNDEIQAKDLGYLKEKDPRNESFSKMDENTTCTKSKYDESINNNAKRTSSVTKTDEILTTDKKLLQQIEKCKVNAGNDINSSEPPSLYIKNKSQIFPTYEIPENEPKFSATQVTSDKEYSRKEVLKPIHATLGQATNIKEKHERLFDYTDKYRIKYNRNTKHDRLLDCLDKYRIKYRPTQVPKKYNQAKSLLQSAEDPIGNDTSKASNRKVVQTSNPSLDYIEKFSLKYNSTQKHKKPTQFHYPSRISKTSIDKAGTHSLGKKEYQKSNKQYKVYIEKLRAKYSHIPLQKRTNYVKMYLQHSKKPVYSETNNSLDKIEDKLNKSDKLLESMEKFRIKTGHQTLFSHGNDIPYNDENFGQIKSGILDKIENQAKTCDKLLEDIEKYRIRNNLPATNKKSKLTQHYLDREHLNKICITRTHEYLNDTQEKLKKATNELTKVITDAAIMQPPAKKTAKDERYVTDSRNPFLKVIDKPRVNEHSTKKLSEEIRNQNYRKMVRLAHDQCIANLEKYKLQMEKRNKLEAGEESEGLREQASENLNVVAQQQTAVTQLQTKCKAGFVPISKSKDIHNIFEKAGEKKLHTRGSKSPTGRKIPSKGGMSSDGTDNDNFPLIDHIQSAEENAPNVKILNRPLKDHIQSAEKAETIPLTKSLEKSDRPKNDFVKFNQPLSINQTHDRSKHFSTMCDNCHIPNNCYPCNCFNCQMIRMRHMYPHLKQNKNEWNPEHYPIHNMNHQNLQTNKSEKVLPSMANVTKTLSVYQPEETRLLNINEKREIKPDGIKTRDLITNSTTRQETYPAHLKSNDEAASRDLGLDLNEQKEDKTLSGYQPKETRLLNINEKREIKPDGITTPRDLVTHSTTRQETNPALLKSNEETAARDLALDLNEREEDELHELLNYTDKHKNSLHDSKTQKDHVKIGHHTSNDEKLKTSQEQAKVSKQNLFATQVNDTKLRLEDKDRKIPTKHVPHIKTQDSDKVHWWNYYQAEAPKKQDKVEYKNETKQFNYNEVKLPQNEETSENKVKDPFREELIWKSRNKKAQSDDADDNEFLPQIRQQTKDWSTYVDLLNQEYMNYYHKTFHIYEHFEPFAFDRHNEVQMKKEGDEKFSRIGSTIGKNQGESRHEPPNKESQLEGSDEMEDEKAPDELPKNFKKITPKEDSQLLYQKEATSDLPRKSLDLGENQKGTDALTKEEQLHPSDWDKYQKLWLKNYWGSTGTEVQVQTNTSGNLKQINKLDSMGNDSQNQFLISAIPNQTGDRNKPSSSVSNAKGKEELNEHVLKSRHRKKAQDTDKPHVVDEHAEDILKNAKGVSDIVFDSDKRHRTDEKKQDYETNHDITHLTKDAQSDTTQGKDLIFPQNTDKLTDRFTKITVRPNKRRRNRRTEISKPKQADNLTLTQILHVVRQRKEQRAKENNLRFIQRPDLKKDGLKLKQKSHEEQKVQNARDIKHKDKKSEKKWPPTDGGSGRPQTPKSPELFRPKPDNADHCSAVKDKFDRTQDILGLISLQEILSSFHTKSKLIASGPISGQIAINAVEDYFMLSKGYFKPFDRKKKTESRETVEIYPYGGFRSVPQAKDENKSEKRPYFGFLWGYLRATKTGGNIGGH